MIEQRPFSAASNKMAYAQAFAGPSARRAVRRVNGRRPLLLPHLTRRLGRPQDAGPPPPPPAAVTPHR